MKFLILTRIRGKSYCLLKDNSGCAAGFTYEQAMGLLGLLKKNKDEFSCSDILHQDFYRVSRVNIEKEKAAGKILYLPKIEVLSRQSGFKIVALEQAEMLKYGCCTTARR